MTRLLLLLLIFVTLLKADNDEFQSALSTYRTTMESSLSTADHILYREGPYAARDYLRALRRKKREIDHRMRKEILYSRRGNLRAAAGELNALKKLQNEFDVLLREELEEMKLICKMPTAHQKFYCMLFRCEFSFWTNMEKIDDGVEEGKKEEAEFWLEVAYAELISHIDEAVAYARTWNIDEKKALEMRNVLMGLWNDKKNQLLLLKKDADKPVDCSPICHVKTHRKRKQIGLHL